MQLKDRCEILIWLKTGAIQSIQKAAKLKGYHTHYGNQLWAKYRDGGLDEYLCLKYKGQVSPLADLEGFWTRLNKDGFSTIKEAVNWLKSEYGLVYKENSLGNYFRTNKIKLKTGRTSHPQKDEEKRAAYKKNMRPN